MSERNGISMRLAEGWDILVDQNPRAQSAILCPACGALCVGEGKSLSESMANSQSILAEHQLSHGQRTGDETL